MQLVLLEGFSLGSLVDLHLLLDPLGTGLLLLGELLLLLLLLLRGLDGIQGLEIDVATELQLMFLLELGPLLKLECLELTIDSLVLDLLRVELPLANRGQRLWKTTYNFSTILVSYWSS